MITQAYDGGVNWMELDYFPAMFDVNCLTLWAFSDERILKAADSGDTWEVYDNSKVT